jgi:hypothetical protein
MANRKIHTTFGWRSLKRKKKNKQTTFKILENDIRISFEKYGLKI